ncbi:MAG: DUF6692 family protein [Sphingomicrobium sp.]
MICCSCSDSPPGRAASCDGDLLVTTRLLDETGNAGMHGMELIVVPPETKDELGYRGYVLCPKT